MAKDKENKKKVWIDRSDKDDWIDKEYPGVSPYKNKNEADKKKKK